MTDVGSNMPPNFAVINYVSAVFRSYSQSKGTTDD